MEVPGFHELVYQKQIFLVPNTLLVGLFLFIFVLASIFIKVIHAHSLSQQVGCKKQQDPSPFPLIFYPSDNHFYFC